jgi:quercetin dioxygenase-like cupin family protein
MRSAAEAGAAAVRESWGRLTWLASSSIGNSGTQTLGRVVIKPGASNPRHYHATCQEILVLLTGRLEHAIADDTVVLEPGDTLVIPRGVPHCARNVADVDAEMVVAYDTGERDFHLC